MVRVEGRSARAGFYEERGPSRTPAFVLAAAPAAWPAIEALVGERVGLGERSGLAARAPK